MSSSFRVSAEPPYVGWPGRYINVRRRGGLLMVMQLNDPLELIREESGISSRFQVSISSRYNPFC